MYEDTRSILFAFLMLMMLVFFCGQSERTSRERPTSTRRPATTQRPTLKTHRTVFEVTGTAKRAYVTYSGTSGSIWNDAQIRVPWRKEINYTNEKEYRNISITVNARADSPGSLRCKLWVNGTLRAEQSVVRDGDLEIATCTYWTP